jgi:hypothetical protein
MKKTLLEVTAEQGEANGFLLAEWYMNDQLILVTPQQKTKNTKIQLEITLPCCVKIVLSGKNRETDTQIVDGKIIADKYLHITSMSLGNYPINEGLLYNKLSVFTPENREPENTTYFYDNGITVFDFQEEDALLWHLKHNNFYQW